MPPTDKTETSAEDKYAATTWGSSEVGGVTDLVVPSGQTCLVKRPGVEGLLREGVLRDIDSLTALVTTEHVERVKGKKSSKKAAEPRSQEQELAAIMNDPGKVANMMHTVDRVVCHVVVKPPVKMTPNDPTRRKSDVIYADMIDLNDKMFIFNFVVGGSRDLERFRQESDRAMGDLVALQEAQDSAE